MADTATCLPDLYDGSPDWLAEAQRVAQLYTYPGEGRPSVLTDIHRVNKFLRLVGDGNYISTACLAAGFSRQHLANWREDAKHGNLAAIALLDALEKAEAFAEADAVTDVRKAGKAGPQFWAASATRLERRHPDRWGKRQDDSTAPKVVVQIGIQHSDVSIRTLSPSTTHEGRESLTIP